MTSRWRSRRGFQKPWLHALSGRRASVLAVCLGLALLFVQIAHPAVHPHETINVHAKDHVTCPVSHAAGNLLLVLPPPAPVCVMLWLISQPLPWLGHVDFDHRLAPRPPPAVSL
jgi:hypothetical protein